MKHFKTLGIVAVGAASLMSFVGAGTASADELTNSNGTTFSGTVVWSLAAGGSAKLVDTAGNPLQTCTGAVKTNTITSQGPGQRIKFKTSYHLSSCTFSTKFLTTSGEEFEDTTAKATGTSEMTINTVLFGSCIYGLTGGTDTGTFSTGSGSFAANTITEKFSGSAFACPATTKWTGAFILTLPSPYIYDDN